jgi:acylphosphatase
METIDLAALRVLIYGDVQGVYFRAFAAQKAKGLGLKGYVRNLPRRDSLEVVVEGERKRLEELLTYLNMGPPAARVERLVTNWSEPSGRYTEFSIKY